MSRERSLKLLASVAALMLVLVACGDDSEPEAPSEQEAEPGEIEEEEAEPEAADHSFTDRDRISLIIPFGPGGGYDTQARILVPYLEEELENLTGLTIDVQPENMPGGGTLVALEHVSQSDDDRTFVYSGNTGANQQVFEGGDVDMAGFTAIGTVGVESLGFVRGPGLADFDQGDVLGLVERSQQEPILVGHTGNEPLLEMMLGLLEQDGIDLNFDYVTLEGTSDLISAMLRGDVDLGFTSMAGVAPLVEDNSEELDFFLTLGCDRHRAAPDTLSIAELDEIPSADVICGAIGEGWRGLLGPAGMDDADAEVVRQALENAIANEQLQEELLATNFEPGSMSREDWANYFSQLIDTWESLAP